MQMGRYPLYAGGGSSKTYTRVLARAKARIRLAAYAAYTRVDKISTVREAPENQPGMGIAPASCQHIGQYKGVQKMYTTPPNTNAAGPSSVHCGPQPFSECARHKFQLALKLSNNMHVS
mmetsp:Transcript_39146/g.63358  ORF Transcript_39146/g.63358 Transcript_39146/m.63358 type:complete len:119 (-) Transcript_39146:7688-8044(-)